METILIGLVCFMPVLALILGLYTLRDASRRRSDLHEQDMLDRDLRRWLLTHRLQYDDRGNPIIHLADLDKNLLPPFGNPAEVKLMVNNSMTREIKPKRPLPDVRDWHKNKGSSEPEPGSEPEPNSNPEPKKLPEPTPAPINWQYEPTDEEYEEQLREQKRAGKNQKDAIKTVLNLSKGGSPEFRRWADIYNNLEV